MNQKANFNIFKILSVADKELIHSSIIKLVINNDKDFLNVFDINKDFKIETEVKKTTKNKKRISFDLVGYSKEDIILFIIENKFKSTPSKDQLELYDTYFKEPNHIPDNKILMVYFKEQVPSDVEEYCKQNNWIIYPYFSTNKSNETFISYLKENIEKHYAHEKIKFLLEEYIEYMDNSWNHLFEKINSTKLFVENDFINMNFLFDRKRDVWFRYLMHIQHLISKEINKEEICYISENDGGSRPIPSVVFWFKGFKGFEEGPYFGIDGDVVKLGFRYNFYNIEFFKHIRKELLNDNKELVRNIIADDNIKFKTNSPNLIMKDKKKNDNSSVMYLISFNLNNWKEKHEFIKSASNILKKYYNTLSKSNS